MEDSPHILMGRFELIEEIDAAEGFMTFEHDKLDTALSTRASLFLDESAEIARNLELPQVCQ